MAARKWMFRGLRPLYSFKGGYRSAEALRHPKARGLGMTARDRRDVAELYFANVGANSRLARELEGWFMSDNNSNSLLWFLAGLGIGAAAGVLYAPRSGDETRQAIRSRAEDGREFVRDRARQAREQAATWADRGREVLSQQKEQFRSAYEAGRQAYQEATAAEGGGPQNP